MKKILLFAVFIFSSVFGFGQILIDTATTAEGVYSNVDWMPEFPGGNTAMNKFIQDNLHYNSTGDIKVGTVLVQFIVEKDGSLSDIHVIKSIDGATEYDKEAVRVVSIMPKWIPGKAHGDVVRVQNEVQVRFGTARVGSSPEEQGTTAIESSESDTTVYTFVEVMPVFLPEGDFYKFLAQNIRYPSAEKKKKIQGVVYVSFIIEKDGSVSNVKLVKGVSDGPGLSTEAIRVISMMPKWKPGEMNGHPARVELVQPVKFKLN